MDKKTLKTQSVTYLGLKLFLTHSSYSSVHSDQKYVMLNVAT